MKNLERPDGSLVTPIGWTLIALGILGVIIGASAESMGGMLAGWVLANLGLGLGVLLLSLGYLVRAIWFLPGRDIAAAEASDPSALMSAVTACDWCGRQLGAGFRTCTSFDHESLAKVSMKVRDRVCREQLRERGYAVADDPD